MKQFKLVHLLLAFLLGVVARMFMEKCSSKVEGMGCHCGDNKTETDCKESNERCTWGDSGCVAKK